MIGAIAAIIKTTFDAKRERPIIPVGGKLRPPQRITTPPSGFQPAPVSTPTPPQRPAITMPAAPIIYWVAARRDGAVWAGPWKSDGVGFTRVPKNYWKFNSREAAQQAIDSDHLENCEPQELDPE